MILITDTQKYMNWCKMINVDSYFAGVTVTSLSLYEHLIIRVIILISIVLIKIFVVVLIVFYNPNGEKVLAEYLISDEEGDEFLTLGGETSERYGDIVFKKWKYGWKGTTQSFVERIWGRPLLMKFSVKVACVTWALSNRDSAVSV